MDSIRDKAVRLRPCICFGRSCLRERGRREGGSVRSRQNGDQADGGRIEKKRRKVERDRRQQGLMGVEWAQNWFKMGGFQCQREVNSCCEPGSLLANFEWKPLRLEWITLGAIYRSVVCNLNPRGRQPGVCVCVWERLLLITSHRDLDLWLGRNCFDDLQFDSRLDLRFNDSNNLSVFILCSLIKKKKKKIFRKWSCVSVDLSVLDWMNNKVWCCSLAVFFLFFHLKVYNLFQW